MTGRLGRDTSRFAGIRGSRSVPCVSYSPSQCSCNSPRAVGAYRQRRLSLVAREPLEWIVAELLAVVQLLRVNQAERAFPLLSALLAVRLRHLASYSLASFRILSLS